MKRVSVVLVVTLLMLAISLFAQTGQVFAQTSTPTPTLRPTLTGARYELDLSSGSTVVIERTLSYGEIAVSVLLLAELVCFVLYVIFRTVRLWLR